MASRRVRISSLERQKLSREIQLKIGKDEDVSIRTKRVAEEIRAVVKRFSPSPGPLHPYSVGGPGSFVESIEIRRNRTSLGRFVAGWTVFSNHPHANFIEFGTGPDKPGSKSPWGPNTPTPEFAPFARAAIFFRGTAP